MRPPEKIETKCLLLRKPRVEDVPDVFDGSVLVMPGHMPNGGKAR